jgi:hypothetical protein
MPCDESVALGPHQLPLSCSPPQIQNGFRMSTPIR